MLEKLTVTPRHLACELGLGDLGLVLFLPYLLEERGLLLEEIESGNQRLQCGLRLEAALACYEFLDFRILLKRSSNDTGNFAGGDRRPDARGVVLADLGHRRARLEDEP